MNENKIKKLVLLASFFLLVACGRIGTKQNIADRINQSNSPTITWGVKADTNLFGFYNIEAQEIQGFDVDIAKALTEIMTDGQGKPVFVEITSKTRIPLLKNGNIDAIIATMTINEERAKQVDFSDVYFDAGQALLVPLNSDIEGLESLTSDHTVLAIKGSSSARNIRELAPQVNVLEMENYSEGFVALQSGQGDALTTDSAILLGMIDQNPNFKLAGDNFTEEPYGIAVDKGQEDWHGMIQAALDEIQANGTYDQIYDKWFGHLEQE